uniref:Uncharacterized protein LOC108039505 n=1 Tax=Drosophila rhopaloa TaxID=1041015 RepID=A0A6P4E240_DRORH
MEPEKEVEVEVEVAVGDLRIWGGPEWQTQSQSSIILKSNFSHKSQEQSKHSRDEDFSEEEFEDTPKDIEYLSSEQDDVHCRSQISQQSTDRSKSFSQIYSEIFEESKERQQKAEWACRTYNINKSKLHRSLQKSGSRELGSGHYESSLGSESSSNLAKRSQEYENRLKQGRIGNINDNQEKCILNKARSPFSELEGPHTHGEEIAKDLRLKRSKRLVNKLERTERWCSHRNQESRKPYSHWSENRCSDDCNRSYLCKHETSAFRTSSVCSRSRKYDSEVTDGNDYPAVCKSDTSAGIQTTATPQSGSQRDYLSSSSTRHRHHHHYRRQRSVPKTYQDRGNSPINIKTRRRMHDYQDLHRETGTEKVRKGWLGRSSASVGVQYPSGDEIEDCSNGRPSSFLNMDHGVPYEFESHKGGLLSAGEGKILGVNNLVPIRYDEELKCKGNHNLQDMEINEGLDETINKDHCMTEDEVRIQNDLYEYTFDDELTKFVGFKTYDRGEEFSDEYGQETKISDEMENFSDDYDQTVTSEEVITEEGNQLARKSTDDEEYIEDGQGFNHENGEDVSLDKLGQYKIFDEESVQSKERDEVKPKSPLSLTIYDADEALMEIPEDFEGSAVVLDDDADFLDITLTDDEEQIRAKLMAAALTTRRSSCSISASSGLKSRRSIESSILSYKPSVIFTRRSRAFDEDCAPRRNDRIALLAEQFLRSFSKSYSEGPEWQPLVEEVTASESNWQSLEEREVTKRTTGDIKDSGTPLSVDRQLLSEEFNKKLHRQLKVIVESFQ